MTWMSSFAADPAGRYRHFSSPLSAAGPRGIYALRRDNILTKEENTMTYTKPGITVLGKAAVVIESSMVKAVHVVLETPGRLGPTPAYDLDE
jgi:hypothetical protein